MLSVIGALTTAVELGIPVLWVFTTPSQLTTWKLRVELFPFAHVFRAGSKIRLIIDAPGNTRPRWKFEALPVPEGSIVRNTVARSAVHASRLVLPWLRDIEITTPLPAAEGYRGQPYRTLVEFENSGE